MSGNDLHDVCWSYLREDNIDRVEIYPPLLGGWHADLVLRTVPVGISDAIGTPLARPAATHEEAEGEAVNLLVHVLPIDQRHPDRAPDGRAVFLLGGRPIFVPVEDLVEREASPGYRRLTKAEALAQLDQMTNTQVSMDQLVEWTLDAMIAGVSRYPASVEGAPTGSGSRIH